VQVHINLCQTCADTLKQIQRREGEAAMIKRSAEVLRGCAVCRLQLPQELRDQPFKTVPKRVN